MPYVLDLPAEAIYMRALMCGSIMMGKLAVRFFGMIRF